MGRNMNCETIVSKVQKTGASLASKNGKLLVRHKDRLPGFLLKAVKKNRAEIIKILDSNKEVRARDTVKELVDRLAGFPLKPSTLFLLSELEEEAKQQLTGFYLDNFLEFCHGCRKLINEKSPGIEGRLSRFMLQAKRKKKVLLECQTKEEAEDLLPNIRKRLPKGMDVAIIHHGAKYLLNIYTHNMER